MTALRYGAGLVALSVLMACATEPASKIPAANGQAATAPAAALLDASYDWHGLVLMPFGTLLKESPIALHEVLLFHDDSHAAVSSELGRDCFTVDGKLPHLVEHEPEEFLLCFSHDRLDRIQTSVHLRADEAAAVFARACAAWLKSSPLRPAAGHSCAGRDRDIAFSAHLGWVSGDGGTGSGTADGNGPVVAPGMTTAGPGAGPTAGSGAMLGAELPSEASNLSLVLSHVAERDTALAH